MGIGHQLHRVLCCRWNQAVLATGRFKDLHESAPLRRDNGPIAGLHQRFGDLEATKLCAASTHARNNLQYGQTLRHCYSRRY